MASDESSPEAAVFRSLIAMRAAAGDKPADAVRRVAEEFASLAGSRSPDDQPFKFLVLRVPDPRIVNRRTQAAFAFVFADSKFSTLRPSDLEHRPTESVFEVLGDSDLVIRAQGTPADLDNLVQTLSVHHVQLSTLRVSRILRYYGHRLPPSSADLTDDEYSRLVQWSSETPAPNASGARTSGPEGGLGSVVLDDPAAPARLRAFIGVEAAGYGLDAFRRGFEDLVDDLTSRDVREGRTVVLNLFECSDGAYEFIVDAYFAHFSTLNRFVDDVAALAADRFRSLRVHTVTHVIANVVGESLPIADPRPRPNRSRDAAERVLAFVDQARLLLPASEHVANLFDRLPEDRRAYLASWLWQLQMLKAYEGYLGETYNSVRMEFAEGYVTDNRTRFLSGIHALSLALNIASSDVVESITRLYFDGHFQEARQIIGFATHRQKPADLTTGECKSFLEAWRGKSMWSELVTIPPELSRWMDAAALTRNAAAHRETRVDMRELGSEAGPAVLSGLRALAVLRALTRLLAESSQPGRGPGTADVLGLRLVVVGPSVARDIRDLRETANRLQEEFRNRPDEWGAWIATNRQSLESIIERLEMAASASAELDRATVGRLAGAAANARKALAGTADLAQLLSFLAGVPSIPWLAQQPAAADAIGVLTSAARQVLRPSP